MCKRKKFDNFVFVLFVLMCFCLIFTEMLNAQKKPEMVLEELEAIKVDADVEDFIFDDITLYPKVFIKKDKIQFLDDKRKVKKEYVFQEGIEIVKEIIYKKQGKFIGDKDIIREESEKERIKGKFVKVKKSKNEKYIGVVEELESEITEKGKEVKKTKFIMLDDDGNIKWEVKHKFWKCFPSPDGTYAIGMQDPEWGGAPLSLINSKGEEKQISEEGANRSSAPHFSISKDGNIITITIKKLRENPDKGIFVVLDKNGNELWRKESEDKSIGGVPSRKYIAVFTTYKETKECILSMCNLKGNVLWEYKPFKGTSHVSFSEDLQYLFSPWELYEVNTGKLLWKHEEYVKGGYIFTTPNFEFIIVISGKWEKHERKTLTFYLFNRNGKKLLYEEFPPDYIIFRDNRPVVNISSDGKNIIIETKEGLKILKNPYAKKM